MTKLVAACYKFSDVPSKLEGQCKKGVIFHLILVGIPSNMTLTVKNRGTWEVFTKQTKSVKHDESYLGR